ncbi:cytosine/adenosine deaminase-related metal-dependent hydrolase [Deinobacterium chartae]|uniref:Cytosine/adenosine deaminase-related metal-dependent hydrolase n=1 Tax=Deinobacterium chartae TaxID=521158 RepID=A0A841HVV9_9DEIO|nr:amidohydrolase family protein [Deinobacterium chartae]MBB6097527.1 cytosine/adenosine deaminase-related metal-dependent hydrolase [Deinobacterium chartae]
MSALRLLTADVVYTGMGLPLAPGAVVVSDTLIVATGRPEELRARYPEALESRAGEVIAPAPVNAHTHLDMSAFGFHSAPYPEWIPWVIAQGRSGLRGLEGARKGLAELRASGVALAGDIVAREDVLEYLLSESDLGGVVYWEVIDAHPATADATFWRTVEKMRAWRRLERPGGPRLGLTPHTAHTVSGRLMSKLVEFARLEGFPLQIHIAESPDELEMFRSGQGALARSITSVFGPLEDIWGRPPGPDLTPVSYLAQLGVLEARPTLIHAVNVTEQDARLIGAAGCPVVTCPRSNAHLSCGTFDWNLFARSGVEIALGTDSSASGESLNVLEEIAFARRLYGGRVPLRELVRAAVKGGHRVMGEKVPLLRRGENLTAACVWEGTTLRPLA